MNRKYIKFISVFASILLAASTASVYASAQTNQQQNTGLYKTNYIFGDADLSGDVSINDVTSIQKFAAAKTDYFIYQKDLADVDSDGEVNIKDATVLQKNLAGTETNSAVGEAYSSDDFAITTGKIYFQIPAGWNTVTKVYCHIWAFAGDGDTQKWAIWQSKAEQCVNEGNGIYSYDISKTGCTFYRDKTYCVIFSTDTGYETSNSIFYTDAIGDTAYTVPNLSPVSPIDSDKKAIALYFRNHSNYGPQVIITTNGNVQGSAVPNGMTHEDVFNYYVNEIDPLTGTTRVKAIAVSSGRNEADIITELAEALNINILIAN